MIFALPSAPSKLPAIRPRSHGAVRGNLRYQSLFCAQLWVSTERATTILLSGFLFFKGFFDIL